MHGAIYSGTDVRDYQIVCAAKEQAFPEEFELPTVRVKDQKDVGACVAHALSSIIEYYNCVQRGDLTEMSTGYIYGNRTNSEHKGPGMIIRDALDAARKCGDVPKEDFPENVEMPKALMLYQRRAKGLQDIGYPNRISEYCRVNTVSAAKQALMAGIPLLMAMDWYSDMRVEDGVLVTNFIGNEGGHCMFIYGWDDRGWKIQNSWSENWGENGKFILPYEIGMAECWAVLDNIVECPVERPFKSKAGKLFAKMANTVIRAFEK